jgi:hypothetical protein
MGTDAGIEVMSTPQFKAIDPAHKELFAVLNKETYSGMGQEIADLDRQRDSYFSGFHEVIKGMSRFSVTPYNNAAKLLPLFEKEQKRRTMGQKTYAQETAAMDRLHEDLNTDENNALMDSLGLISMESRLHDANQHFKLLYPKAIDANAALLQQSSASKKRKPLEEALRDFYTLVEAMKKIAPWTDLHADLSELVKRTKF